MSWTMPTNTEVSTQKVHVEADSTVTMMDRMSGHRKKMMGRNGPYLTSQLEKFSVSSVR